MGLDKETPPGVMTRMHLRYLAFLNRLETRMDKRIEEQEVIKVGVAGHFLEAPNIKNGRLIIDTNLALNGVVKAKKHLGHVRELVVMGPIVQNSINTHKNT